MRWMSCLILSFFMMSIMPDTAYASDPPVKKSRSGICHPKGGTYYGRTKNFKAYNSMEACLQSGGRAPHR